MGDFPLLRSTFYYFPLEPRYCGCHSLPYPIDASDVRVFIHALLGQTAGDPDLGDADGLQAGLSSVAEVARHLDGVSGAAKVGVDPISAFQKHSGRERVKQLLVCYE